MALGWRERVTTARKYSSSTKRLANSKNLPITCALMRCKKPPNRGSDYLGRGGAAQVATVADACSRYVQHLKATKTERAAQDAEARFKNYVLVDAKLAATELPKLTPAQLEAWRKALKALPTRSGANRGQGRSDSTLNRDMTCFRAALNLAYLDGLLTVAQISGTSVAMIERHYGHLRSDVAAGALARLAL
jgi:hypothetical protein